MPFNKVFALAIMMHVVVVGCQIEGSPDAHRTFAEKTAMVGVVSADSLVLRPSEGVVYYHGTPFSGTSQEVKKGRVVAEIGYWQGLRSGKHTLWFADGTKSYESDYLRGKKVGTAYTWWKDGTLRSESNFDNGVPHGIQKQWYPSGSLFKQLNLVDGHEEGLQQSWRENGKIYSNYEAKNGRIFGIKRAELCYELDNEKVK